MTPLNLQINVYILSIIKKDWMDSKVEKFQKRQSTFKYQSHIYNIHRESDVYHRGMKMRRNKKLFPWLNVINGKTSTYASKGIIIHYHYRSDPKLGLVIVSIRRIPCSCHYWTTILSLSWGYKIKEAVNQPRYGRFYNCKYSQILGYYNNFILMNF